MRCGASMSITFPDGFTSVIDVVTQIIVARCCARHLSFQYELMMNHFVIDSTYYTFSGVYLIPASLGVRWISSVIDGNLHLCPVTRC